MSKAQTEFEKKRPFCIPFEQFNDFIIRRSEIGNFYQFNCMLSFLVLLLILTFQFRFQRDFDVFCFPIAKFELTLKETFFLRLMNVVKTLI